MRRLFFPFPSTPKYPASVIRNCSFANSAFCSRFQSETKPFSIAFWNAFEAPRLPAAVVDARQRLVALLLRLLRCHGILRSRFAILSWNIRSLIVFLSYVCLYFAALELDGFGWGTAHQVRVFAYPSPLTCTSPCCAPNRNSCASTGAGVSARRSSSKTRSPAISPSTRQNVQTSRFEYDAGWLSRGFSISPFSLPLRPGLFRPTWEPFTGCSACSPTH